ncbi:MAG TPA: hypothetical protein VJI15_02970 [Candidatus Nanoarchaeia archaeon]|nr:hypothetical protein [Candidatus Nanoarchaeia archaeon]
MDYSLFFIDHAVQFLDLAMSAVIILIVWYGFKLAARLLSKQSSGH